MYLNYLAMKKITFLKQAFFLTVALSFIGVFQSCDKEDNPVVNPEAKKVTFKAESFTEWTYFSFEKGTVVTVDQEEYSENLNWDMGFLRFNIRTNGGTSGKGQGAVYATDKKSFDEVTTIPTSGLITDSEISVMKSGDMPPKYAKTTGNTAFKVGENQGWAFYNYKSGDWTINNNVFIVRSANGKYAKVIMKNFLNEKDESGYITFEYVYPFN
ncbi:MAG TPA: hypothetical protein DEG28_09850 [Porphyromonadaceae bacterium]|jgi:hypothetical protein|nr:hypothetical protein [Porphyromonadaceae bacterium]